MTTETQKIIEQVISNKELQPIIDKSWTDFKGSNEMLFYRIRQIAKLTAEKALELQRVVLLKEKLDYYKEMERLDYREFERWIKEKELRHPQTGMTASLARNIGHLVWDKLEQVKKEAKEKFEQDVLNNIENSGIIKEYLVKARKQTISEILEIINSWVDELQSSTEAVEYPSGHQEDVEVRNIFPSDYKRIKEKINNLK